MSRSLIGPRIRDRRRVLGVTQTGLAAKVGISASYLNLIEGNKRSIGGALLRRIAAELGLGVDEFDGAPERRLLADLGELAGDPLLAELHLDHASAEELASRHGSWAHALIRMHRTLLDRDQAVSALSDRLSQDPFLGDAVHSMLTRVAAIRSSAEILETVEDLEPARRDRFVSIIGSESRRLADVAQSLAAFFDQDRSGTRSVTPVEEIDDFIFDRDNHFPTLEEAADALRARAAIEDDASDSKLIEHLRRAHSVSVTVRPASALQSGDLREGLAYDAHARTLTIADTVPAATRRFMLARTAAELFDDARPIDAILDATPLLTSDAARRGARRVLASYFAAAMLLPYEAFRAAAIAARYDIDYLGQRFGVSFEQVCHRLVTLRRPGAEGIPFGLMRVDAAGFVTKRFPLPHLLLPRHGNACPLWAVYEAFQSPGAMVRQLAAFPTGDRFLFLARTVEKPRPAFALPRRMFSLMLACDALYADQTLYGDGLDLSSSAPAVPVGPNCRLCVRRDCAYREEEPIINT